MATVWLSQEYASLPVSNRGAVRACISAKRIVSPPRNRSRASPSINTRPVLVRWIMAPSAARKVTRTSSRATPSLPTSSQSPPPGNTSASSRGPLAVPRRTTATMRVPSGDG
jgi:hypothetical protein